MTKSSAENSIQDQNKKNITKLFLRKMRERQSCCPVCPYCHDTIIDESITLANLYAELALQ